MVKVSELSGQALDWAVANCEGAFNWRRNEIFHHKPLVCSFRDEDDPLDVYSVYLNELPYTADWSLGGPIIERENLTLFKRTDVNIPEIERYQAICGHDGVIHQGKRGPTYLIAAMRCYVASKMGDEVDVPEELQ